MRNLRTKHYNGVLLSGESALGPNASEVYGKNLDRQAFDVCMQNLKTQEVSQGVPLYQLVINPNLFNRLVRP